MALFGEKYGDVVRMVEVGDGSFSRELCGGTHVHNTAEIGLFKVLGETSSAANVRRIEAVTGPDGVALLRRHDQVVAELSEELRVPPERIPAAVAELRGRVRDLERELRSGGAGQGQVDVDQLISAAVEVDGTRMIATTVAARDGKALLEVADRVKNKFADGVIVLGSAGPERVDLVASVAPSLVDRGVRAGEIVKAAAAVVGGGGGGRDTLARAGGRDAEKLPQAIEAARAAVETALAATR
jgi:alanyl-tRNA synthetase